MRPQDIILSTISLMLGLLLVVYVILLVACHDKETSTMPGIVRFLREFADLVSHLQCKRPHISRLRRYRVPR